MDNLNKYFELFYNENNISKICRHLKKKKVFVSKVLTVRCLKLTYVSCVLTFSPQTNSAVRELFLLFRCSRKILETVLYAKSLS